MRIALVLGSTALVILFSPLVGPVPIPPLDVLSILLHELSGGAFPSSACPAYVHSSQCKIWVEIVWGARVPAAMLAAAVGASLGLSGAGLQAVFRNSLADPYLLGLSAGAALGASLAFAYLGIYDPSLSYGDRVLLLPALAFAGGLVPGGAVLLASTRREIGPSTLLLTGVALSACFSAMLATVILFFPNVDLQLTFWLLGSVSNNANWPSVGLVVAVLMLSGTTLALYAPSMNLLQLGDDVAKSLGVDARRVTRRVVLLATVTTATAVAFAGIVGFVGLVAPHMVRRLVGVDYRKVIPLSTATGAIFLVLSWDIAQSVVPSIVLPLGIPTSFVGSMFFLYLLQRRQRSDAASGALPR